MPSKAKQTKVKSKGTVPGKAERQDAVEELKKLEEKGVQVVEQLRDVERQIYQLETKYLETCNPVGNALKGYEGLLTQPQPKKPAKNAVHAEDRLFSGSSKTGTAPPV
eukprot:jgi/Chrzof1/3265/Cz12g18120.t1